MNRHDHICTGSCGLKDGTFTDVPDRDQRLQLVESVNEGEFWKPCPGTTAGYLCCGYQILTPLTGCGMYCRYCILQSYFDDHRQVHYTNWSDLEHEVRTHLEHSRQIIRFGTGEFADSLFLEPQLGLCCRIAALLEPYPNVIVEFKTKSNHVEALARIRNPRKVIIGFSMNTPGAVALHERGTASLEQRLEAAARCEEMGFWLAFHFDPMIWQPDWENEYRAVVERIFDTVQDPSRIAWWSCGGFRTTPALKNYLKERGVHLPLFGGELIRGEDRKLRYARPLRAAMYRLMRETVESRYAATPLYLCMESEELWRDSGLESRIPSGLVRYLDDRAAAMLSYTHNADGE